MVKYIWVKIKEVLLLGPVDTCWKYIVVLNNMDLLWEKHWSLWANPLVICEGLIRTESLLFVLIMMCFTSQAYSWFYHKISGANIWSYFANFELPCGIGRYYLTIVLINMSLELSLLIAISASPKGTFICLRICNICTLKFTQSWIYLEIMIPL